MGYFDCRRLPETREGDSDDSTDSEEELDSPKRITQQQQPGEKMDVDHSANDGTLLHSNKNYVI